METPRPGVMGTFADRAAAEAAVQALEGAGFTPEEIGFLAPETPRDTPADAHPLAGVAVGAATGSVVAGLLAGLTAITLAGVGPFVAGGVLGAIIIGASVGSVSGGMIGGVIGSHLGQEPPPDFEEQLRSGRAIVTVEGDRLDEARRILEESGALRIS
ncbi:MAG: hypothetical protein E6I70_13565 [Chloroflexi bacterium]|nr:MAG: hypothetical protein E6I70_13565 [Chloroflexota bacterium]